MGLIKRNGYNVKGVELKEAYAKIVRLYIEHDNKVNSYFGISSNRENINEGKPLEEVNFQCYIDKSLPIYEQIYTEAKKNIFQGWEDDIVVEEPTENDSEIVEEDIPNESEEETTESTLYDLATGEPIENTDE